MSARTAPFIPRGHRATVRRYDTGDDIAAHVRLIGHASYLAWSDPRIIQLADDIRNVRCYGVERGAPFIPVAIGKYEYHFHPPDPRARGDMGKLWSFMDRNIAYLPDDDTWDTFRDPIGTLATGGGDCFTLDTKIIARPKGSELEGAVSLGDLRATWREAEAKSYDFAAKRWTWSPITAWVSRGEKAVWRSSLAQDRQQFFHTGDHRVWWWDWQAETMREESFREARTSWRTSCVVAPGPTGFDPTNDPNLPSGRIVSHPDVDAREVCDITVEGTHNFVLFNGLLAHNCDDQTALIDALSMSLGHHPVGARVIGVETTVPSHIYALVVVNGVITPMDTAVPDFKHVAGPGWEYPEPKSTLDFWFRG